MFKIVNFRKFFVSNVILVLLVSGCIFAIVNITYSHSDQRYKTIYTEEGDTLWNIANIEKENNSHYKNKDIRYIVNDIKQTNNLQISDLKVGQKLLVPIN